MKENQWPIQELAENQLRIYIDTTQLYEAYEDARAKGRSFTGGMHWKTAKGRQYLFQTVNRKGEGKSLGPRTPATERLYSAFHEGKQASIHRLAHLKARLAEQARFAKAARIHRVPRRIARVARMLGEHGVPGERLIVVGPNALYAYEAAAGVFLDPSLLPSRDAPLTLLADPAIDPAKRLRLANRPGISIELVEEKRLYERPWFSAVVIGTDGFPARMVVPDPRSFSLHKLWVSEQEDRDPAQKRRDVEQAGAVLALIERYLPAYRVDKISLKMVPKALMDRAKDYPEPDLPPGLAP